MDAIEAKQITEDLKESHQAQWKTVRSLLLRLEDEGGYKALGYSLFKQYIKSEFGTDCQNYSTERTSGKIEQLIGVAPCTYPAYALRPLRQFRAIREIGKKGKDKEPKIRLLRQCWAIAQEIAVENGRELPDANDIIAAKLRMHENSPESIKKPTPANGVGIWKKRCQDLEIEIAELKKKCGSAKAQANQFQKKYLAIEAEVVELRKSNAKIEAQLQVIKNTDYLVHQHQGDNNALRRANLKMQHQMSALQEEILLLRRANKDLSSKNELLQVANRNLSSRTFVGVTR